MLSAAVGLLSIEPAWAVPLPAAIAVVPGLVGALGALCLALIPGAVLVRAWLGRGAGAALAPGLLVGALLASLVLLAARSPDGAAVLERSYSGTQTPTFALPAPPPAAEPEAVAPEALAGELEAGAVAVHLDPSPPRSRHARHRGIASADVRELIERGVEAIEPAVPSARDRVILFDWSGDLARRAAAHRQAQGERVA